jgi:hypothetical protein
MAAAVHDPMLRSVTNAIARMLTSYQRFAPLAPPLPPPPPPSSGGIVAATITMIAPKPDLCSDYFSASQQQSLALSTATIDGDGGGNYSSIIVESLRMCLLDIQNVSNLVAREVEACLVRHWNAWGLSLTENMRGFIAERLRMQIESHLTALVLPCGGLPVNQQTVTVSTARDMAWGVITAIRETEEFYQLQRQYNNGNSYDYGYMETGTFDDGVHRTTKTMVCWWWLLMIVTLMLILMWAQRRALIDACRNAINRTMAAAAAARENSSGGGRYYNNHPHRFGFLHRHHHHRR